MALEFNTTTSTIENGTGGIKIAPGSSEIVTVENGLLIPDGIKTEPAVRFTDDANTGIYSPQDDSVAITGHGEEVLLIEGTTSSVNKVKVKSSIATTGPIISAEGTDTNIDLNIDPKGTGSVTIDGLKYPTADGTANQVIETDGSGVLSFVDAGSGGGGATELDGLSDVTMSVAPPAARYWRLNWSENAGNASYTGVAEIQFRESIGGPDETTGGVSDAETSLSGSDNAFLATGDYLTANGSPIGWLSYDFGSGNDKSIVEYTIAPHNSNSVQPMAWILEYSSDNTNWTTAATVTTEPDWSGLETRTYTTPMLADNDHLIYNSTTSQWENGPLPAGDTQNVYLEANNGAVWNVQPIADATSAIAIGSGTNTKGGSNICIGNNAKFNDNGSTAGIMIGDAANGNSGADYLIGIGVSAQVRSTDAICIGRSSVARKIGGICIGALSSSSNEVSGHYSISLGYSSSTINANGATVSIGPFMKNSDGATAQFGTAVSEGVGEQYLKVRDSGNLTIVGTAAQYVQPSYASGSEPTGTAGGTVYNTTDKSLMLHDGTSWNSVSGAVYAHYQYSTAYNIKGSDIYSLQSAATVDTSGYFDWSDEIHNNSGITRSQETFTLPAGTWKVSANSVVSYKSTTGALIGAMVLYDVTNSAVVVAGRTNNANITSTVSLHLGAEGTFTLASSASLTFKLLADNGAPLLSQGPAHGLLAIGDNIHSDVVFTKIG